MTTPAGWYSDPDGSGGQRYWDGNSWTQHRAPATPPPPPAPEPAPEPTPPPRPAPPAPTPPMFTEQPAPAPHTPPSAAATTAFSTPPSGPQDPPPPAYVAAAPDPDAARKKLIQRYSIGVGVGLVALIAAVLLAVFSGNSTSGVTISSPSSTAAAPTNKWTSAPTTSDVPQETTASSSEDAIVNDGGLTFEVTGVDVTSTVTSPTTDVLSKEAQGEFIVVSLTVTNNGTEAGSYNAQLQKLRAMGSTFDADPEASFYVGTIYEDINPGNSLDTAIVFDVPVGTQPEAIELYGTAVSVGAEVTFE